VVGTGSDSPVDVGERVAVLVSDGVLDAGDSVDEGPVLVGCSVVVSVGAVVVGSAVVGATVVVGSAGCCTPPPPVVVVATCAGRTFR
jgi:hypothetical protein